MKIVCIDNRQSEKTLTLDKVYQVVGVDFIMKVPGFGEFYRIVDDLGDMTAAFTWRFKSLSDAREEKLDQIL